MPEIEEAKRLSDVFFKKVDIFVKKLKDKKKHSPII